MTNDALIGEINSAYRRLSAATEDVRAMAEVDRLHLIVRLLGTKASEGTGEEWRAGALV